MKIKRITSFVSALVISLSSVFLMNFGTALAVAYDCTWTGATNDNFNTAGNWTSCNGTVPQTGDNLVFTNTSLGANKTLNNDITSLSVGTITFNGTNSSYAFKITGNGITVTSAITDSSSAGAGPTIATNFTLGGVTTITSTNNYLNLGVDNTTFVDTGTYGLTFSGTKGIILESLVKGSGDITVSTTSDGRVIFAGASSTYTGNITISSGGQVTAYEVDALGSSGTVTVASGGEFAIYGIGADKTIAKSFAISGTGLNGYGAFQTGSGSSAATAKITISGNFTLNADSTVSIGNDVTVSGTYTTNGHALTIKTGSVGNFITSSGTATAVASTTTINSGDNDSSTSVSIGNKETYVIDGIRGDTAVSSGGTLKGTGKLGSLTIYPGGIVAPGHSPGCLSTGNLNISGTYQAEIGGTTACSDYDQLIVTGTVDVSNGTLTVSRYNSYKPKAGETYTIISNDGSDTVTGTFNDLAEGTTFKVDGYVMKISYKGGDGNDVTLTVVSVPSTPNTGYGKVLVSPVGALAVSTIAAASLFGLSRKYKKVLVRK